MYELLKFTAEHSRFDVMATTVRSRSSEGGDGPTSGVTSSVTSAEEEEDKRRIPHGKVTKTINLDSSLPNSQIDTLIQDARARKVAKEVRLKRMNTGEAEKVEATSEESSLRSQNNDDNLKKDSPSSDIVKKLNPPAYLNIDAPVFVPKNFNVPATTTATTTTRTYADVVGPAMEEQNTDSNLPEGSAVFGEMCAYAMVGECRFGDQCMLIHGQVCDFCGQACLHPYDAVQRENHAKECVEQHEQDMELSFAVARSSDKTCGICMEVVMEKSPAGEQRFGILPSCNHCFCLSCLRRWRQARQFENRIIRACPECRITSDFVCPSRLWVESKEDKEKLIRSYKIALSKKACRYYRNGSGECPFGNKCFYLHALPDGTKIDVGPPRRATRPRRAPSESGSDHGPTSASIWDFLEDWELQWMDIEEFMDEIFLAEERTSSSDDSDDDVDNMGSLIVH